VIGLGDLDRHVLGSDIMMRQVNMAGYLRDRGWTRLEAAIWIVALVFAITSGILLATQVVGRWVLPVGGVIVLALGLMRYRAETEQKRRSADDRSG